MTTAEYHLFPGWVLYGLPKECAIGYRVPLATGSLAPVLRIANDLIIARPDWGFHLVDPNGRRIIFGEGE
jgi:hypothetical protein